MKENQEEYKGKFGHRFWVPSQNLIRKMGQVRRGGRLSRRIIFHRKSEQWFFFLCCRSSVHIFSMTIGNFSHAKNKLASSRSLRESGNRLSKVGQ